jgi:hypothetical protein
MTKQIELTQEKYAIVDDEDFEWLNKSKWHYDTRYARRAGTYGFGKIFMHREIARPGRAVVDHINGNTLDNRKENLRICEQAENIKNKTIQKNSTSGYKGVSIVKGKKRDKWTAMISINNQMTYLGTFSTPEDAARAYDSAANENYGRFAKTNF